MLLLPGSRSPAPGRERPPALVGCSLLQWLESMHSFRITVASRHFEIEQNLSDGHRAYLFRSPAKLLGQNETRFRERRLHHLLQGISRRADSAQGIDLLDEKTGQARGKLRN